MADGSGLPHNGDAGQPRLPGAPTRRGHEPAPGAPGRGAHPNHAEDLLATPSSAATGGGLPASALDGPGAVRSLEGWLARLGVFVVSIVLFRLGFELWWIGRIHENPFVQFVVVVFYAAGLAFLFLSFLRMRHERLHFVGFTTLIVCLCLYAMVSMTIVNLRYTSDALMFVHQSANVFIGGNNPYSTDLVGGYEQFEVPYYVATPTTTGGTITNLNYPALAFLIYAPFVALGIPDLRPISLAFLLALLALFYLAVPKALRLLVVSVLFLSSFFLAFSLSGFDIVFIYFVIATIAFWDRHKGWAAFFFGLACATKQTIWFAGPFFLAALWNDQSHLPERQRLRALGKQFGIVIATFLVPNLPFILWDPEAWVRGVLTPFGLSHDVLVPLSQGITVPFYTGLLSFDPLLLHLLAGTVLLVLLMSYWRHYERLKPLVWMTPPFVLAFTERSLQNYFEMFYPVGLFIIVRHAPFLTLGMGMFAPRPASTTDPPPAPSGRSIMVASTLLDAHGRIRRPRSAGRSGSHNPARVPPRGGANDSTDREEAGSTRRPRIDPNARDPNTAEPYNQGGEPEEP